MGTSLAENRTRVLSLETSVELQGVLEDVYEETGIRHLAAQRLGQQGDEGKQALLNAFANAKENPPGRVAALQALVRYFPKEAEPILLEALDDLWPRVRRSANILLHDKKNRIAPTFRLRYHLPYYLKNNAAACAANLNALCFEDQVCVWQAIGKARFSAALLSLVEALGEYDQAKSRKYPLAEVVLKTAILVFGDSAIPFLELALNVPSKNSEGFLHLLALMDSKEAKMTLLSLKKTQLRERTLYWVDWRQRRLDRESRMSRVSYPKTHQPPPLSPLPPMLYQMSAQAVLGNDVVAVGDAIELLKREQDPEVGVLFWVLADDHETPLAIRQRAHNALEFWRRYNGHGKW